MNEARVLLIASLFPPAQSAGVFRTLRFSRHLPECGWDVAVLTVDPNHYEPQQPRTERLLQKLHPDTCVIGTRAVYPVAALGKIKRTFSRNGNVARGAPAASQDVPEVVEGSKSPWRRLKDAVTEPLMTPDRLAGWVPFAVRAGLKHCRSQSVRVLYSTGPPFSNHVVGLKLKRKTGLPWIADFRDPWVSADFRPIRRSNTWVGRRHRKLESLVAQEADRLLFTTPEIRDDMLRRHPTLPAEKCRVIYNGFDPHDYTDLACPVPKPRADRPLILAHAGSFYGKRTVVPLLQAMGRLKRHGRLADCDLRLKLIGAARPGRTLECDQARRAGIENWVEITPPVGHAECLEQLAAADALLLVQTEAPMCIPGKVFEYLALGKPIFTLCDGGATARFVRDERIGWCVSPESESDVDNGLLDLVTRFRSGLPLPVPDRPARQRYDGIAQTRQLADLFREISHSL